MMEEGLENEGTGGINQQDILTLSEERKRSSGRPTEEREVKKEKSLKNENIEPIEIKSDIPTRKKEETDWLWEKEINLTEKEMKTLSEKIIEEPGGPPEMEEQKWEPTRGESKSCSVCKQERSEPASPEDKDSETRNQREEVTEKNDLDTCAERTMKPRINTDAMSTQKVDSVSGRPKNVEKYIQKDLPIIGNENEKKTESNLVKHMEERTLSPRLNSTQVS